MTTEEAQRLRIQRALDAIADGLWSLRVAPHASNLWWVANGGGTPGGHPRSSGAWDMGKPTASLV